MPPLNETLYTGYNLVDTTGSIAWGMRFKRLGTRLGLCYIDARIALNMPVQKTDHEAERVYINIHVYTG